jgi:hypothetical protein
MAFRGWCAGSAWAIRGDGGAAGDLRVEASSAGGAAADSRSGAALDSRVEAGSAGRAAAASRPGARGTRGGQGREVGDGGWARAGSAEVGDGGAEPAGSKDGR